MPLRPRSSEEEHDRVTRRGHAWFKEARQKLCEAEALGRALLGEKAGVEYGWGTCTLKRTKDTLPEEQRSIAREQLHTLQILLGEPTGHIPASPPHHPTDYAAIRGLGTHEKRYIYLYL